MKDPKFKHIAMPIDADLLYKFHYVASYDGRSLNSQTLHLINKCIREYEEKHGRIEYKPEGKE